MTTNNLVITGWKDLMARIGTFNEDELRMAINYEASAYRRRTILNRLHMRYCKLRDAREREEIVSGQRLL